MEKEYRSLNIESKEENGELILEGYAVVFNSQAMIGDEKRGFYEEIAPNALDNTDLKDVPLKWNHSDTPFVLARTRNKSLELKVDDHGLFIRAKLLSNVQQHRDVYEMVKNGLVDKMSFAFTIGEQKIDRSGSIPKRIITKIDKLFDVSAVTTPAYSTSELHARSIEMVEQEIATIEQQESEKRNSEVELEKLKCRIRLSLI